MFLSFLAIKIKNFSCKKYCDLDHSDVWEEFRMRLKTFLLDYKPLSVRDLSSLWSFMLFHGVVGKVFIQYDAEISFLASPS